jgi:methylated-DNA-protein-cysteine methyltransferase-like protein
MPTSRGKGPAALDRPVTDTRTPFESAVETIVRDLRRGEVSSYGEIAEDAGFPGAARAVGAFLSKADGLPWWRVVRADGTLASPNAAEQRRRLQAEGVRVVAGKVVPRQGRGAPRRRP